MCNDLQISHSGIPGIYLFVHGLEVNSSYHNFGTHVYVYLANIRSFTMYHILNAV